MDALTNAAIAWDQRATNLLLYLALLTREEQRSLANRLFWMKGADDIALFAYQTLVATLRDPAEVQIARSFIASIMARTGHIDDAYQYLRSVPHETIGELHGTYALVDYYGMLAKLSCARKDYRRQLTCARKAMEESHNISDAAMRRREQSDRKQELACAYVNAGQYHNAMKLYDELAQSEESPDYKNVWKMNRQQCADVLDGKIVTDWKIETRQW
jgi:tetratricopeptide (TPR) repeat protein